MRLGDDCHSGRFYPPQLLVTRHRKPYVLLRLGKVTMFREKEEQAC